MSLILIALGGNALGHDVDSQRTAIEGSVARVGAILAEGHGAILTHGNGPQVGLVKSALDAAAEASGGPLMPLPESGAMTQGYIGFHIQMAMANAIRNKPYDRPVTTVVTTTVVDAADPAFDNPTKPIGRFYTKEQADEMHAATGEVLVEDSGRGYRVVVPSPKPVRVVETPMIAHLMEAGTIPVIGGGGGIPVIETDAGYEPVAAVIDKDFTSARLAADLGCDTLVLLTGVPKIAVGFGTPEQRWLDEISVAQAEEFIAAGEFPPGSMLPKVEAAIEFARSAPGRRAVITSLESLTSAALGTDGTHIVA